MWSDSESERELRQHEAPPARSNVALAPAAGAPGATAVAAAAAAAAAAPQIAQLNVSSNSRMHIGPKFVSVTQTVHNNEVVKGRVLGLELQAGVGRGARRLRCSVAVFVCWALAVAAALSFYVCRLALAGMPGRLDLEVGLVRYVWEWAQRTTRAERLACAAALGALVLCATLAATLTAPRAPPEPDTAPHSWNITRRMWLAEAHGEHEAWAPRFLPLRLVVVQHSAGPQCTKFADCAALMRTMQHDYLKNKGYDLPYNFVVGNDGRVYEGRGWRRVGAHTRGFNRCSLGLGFTGDYRDVGGARASALQLNRTLQLLAGGVRSGVLHARYRVLAACDVQSTASPGEHLYAALSAWPHFDASAARFQHSSCDEIYAALRADEPLPPAQ